MEELQAQAGPPSNNELQIAMGTRSSLLLPCWTNNEQWLGLRRRPNICAFYISNFNKTDLYYTRDVVSLCNGSSRARFSLHGRKHLMETDEQSTANLHTLQKMHVCSHV